MKRTEMTIANKLNDGTEGITRSRGREGVPEGAGGDQWRAFGDLEADLKRLAGVGGRRCLERFGGSDSAADHYLGLGQVIELRGSAAEAVNRPVPVVACGSRF